MTDRLLHDLVRDEYDHPTRGDCTLLVSNETWDLLKQWIPTNVPPIMRTPRAIWSEMSAINVRFDQSVPYNRWRLVKNSGPLEVVEEGQAVLDA